MSVLHHSLQRAAVPNLENMEVMRNHCELFRAGCRRLILETEKACKRMQSDDTKQLDQRIRDIQFLKKELELRLEEINVGIDDLLVLQSRVVKALEACKEPLRVTILCLEERTKRFPSERRHDDVYTELLKEREIIEGVEVVLQHVVEQIIEQIRLHRSSKYQLEKDLKEKLEAQSIDNSCALMTNHNIEMLQKSKHSQAIMQSLAVTPVQWENISDIHITTAEQQQTNSQSLQALVKSILTQTTTDMQRQIQATNTAFQLNVQEIKTARRQMEDQLVRTLSEIVGQQRIREDLQVAVTESEHSLALAQSRLALRHRRPGKEQCYDPAQAQLLAEVYQLPISINKLHEAVSRSEEEQRALIRCQLDLQENIEKKANSLYIDKVICAQHRSSIIIQNF
ncbi:tektin-1 [Notolabrus celidotus]|uniref:tektin-1 n=1 Tax=Notolabrus celidotus TaxID=1203425 RepID=UPI001490595A|nr:tektin-1 [Notolabrus celidotus]XP_034557870.1 tektin-1 [Notolabrus celidotus]